MKKAVKASCTDTELVPPEVLIWITKIGRIIGFTVPSARQKRAQRCNRIQYC